MSNGVGQVSQERPPGGNCWEAAQLAPDGWVCLSPWIQTRSGHWWRAQLNVRPDHKSDYGDEAKAFAEHYADQMNAAAVKIREETGRAS